MTKTKVLLLVIAALAVLGSPVRGTLPGEPSGPEVARQGPPRKDQKPVQDPAQQDRPQGKTAISVAVDLVSLHVLVTDKKGNVVTGLRPENFTVYEDNVKQEIVNFAPVDSNMTVVMLVEYSKLVPVYEVWQAIYGFAERLKPGDWVAVIGYDIRPTILCDFTQNRNELYEALSRFTYPAFSESNLADALIFTLERVADIEGKVAILLISTGLDTFSRHTYDEALKACKESRASVYAIGLWQSTRIRLESLGYLTGPDNLEFLMADNRLKSFAEFTGGEAFFPRFVTEYPSIFQNISIQLRNQYSLAYVSSNTKKDGKFRKIRVEVKADLRQDGKPVEFKVFTRKGYQAKSEG